MSVQLRFHEWPDHPCLVWDGWCVRITGRLTSDEALSMHQIQADSAWHGDSDLAEDVTDPDVTAAVEAMVRMRRAGALTEEAMGALERVVVPWLRERHVPYEVREAAGIYVEVE